MLDKRKIRLMIKMASYEKQGARGSENQQLL